MAEHLGDYDTAPEWYAKALASACAIDDRDLVPHGAGPGRSQDVRSGRASHASQAMSRPG